MINREATIKYKGYDPSDLSFGSNKRVCFVCDICGRVRYGRLVDYRNLCMKCTQLGKVVSQKTRQKLSLSKSGKNHPLYGKTGEKSPNYNRHHTQQAKDKMSKNHADISGENHPLYGKHHTEKTRELMSSKKMGKYTGKNNPNWRGGVTKQPYCNLFNLPLKEAIRLYFNNNCFIDNEPEESGRALSVHHVNYDKRCGCDATQFCIFIPVKTKWNLIFNGNKEHNRWYWYSFLMNKIFIENPNYFGYHIPVWGMNELEYNYDYVFEKFRRRK